MLYSMTGYGEFAHEDERLRAGFRIRSVNNKGIDLNLKLPFDLMYLESRLRSCLKKKLFRGRIDVFCEIEIRDPDVRPNTPLNLARLAQLQDMAKQMKDVIGATGDLDVNTLVKLPDIALTQRVGFRLPEDMQEAIESALEGAVDRLTESRAKEGAKLLADFQKRIEVVEAKVNEVKETVVNRNDDIRAQILDRVKSALAEFNLDDNRLYQEVVFNADRLDISEEITRLLAHLGTARDLFNSNRRPLGKRLDFLTQEMLREVGTIGNKAKHEAIAALVVDLKTELEKIREQVQNVE